MDDTPIERRAPAFTPVHLDDCLTSWREHVDPTIKRGVELTDEVALEVFNQIFLMGSGQWLDTPQGLVLGFDTQQGWRGLDRQGTLYTEHPQEAAALEAGQPVIDCKALRYHQQSLQARIGIGFHFQRTREDLDGQAIVEALWQYSCHPFLGKRIVEDLMAHGERAATVMPALEREAQSLRHQLAPLGVAVSLTAPMPSRGTREVPEDQANVDLHLPRKSPRP
jgi:hypothetical protein